MNRHQIDTMSKIADRGLIALGKHSTCKVRKLDLMMDLEYTNDVIPLDLDQFLAFDNGNFNHDISGIYVNFNRETLQMDNCFMPRCAKQ